MANGELSKPRDEPKKKTIKQEVVQTKGDECSPVATSQVCNHFWRMTTRMEDIVGDIFMKTYKYKCDICGRPLFKKIRMHGMTLCSKHMHQILKHGHALDNNPRTQKDLNEFRYLDKNTIEFDVYNAKCEIVNHFWIDADDLQKVRYHKWRIDTNNHIITGNCSKTRPRRELSHIIMDCPDDKVVDHIDGDSRNNKKNNLRVCTQAENLCNKHFMSNSTSGEIGIHWDKHIRRWAPEIQKDGKRYHLCRYQTIEEARYARYIGERILFKEFRNNIEYDFKDLSDERKNEIKTYVEKKILGN